MSPKISIRFFNDREVRALWDERQSKWWFSVLDIVAVLTDQNDYGNTRNYWKYLKAKLKKEGSEVVSATTQLKIPAPDGKQRLSDTKAKSFSGVSMHSCCAFASDELQSSVIPKSENIVQYFFIIDLLAAR
jgi:hypothetical protein